MATDEMKKLLALTWSDPMPGTPDSLVKFHAAEIEKWGRLIRNAKIEAQ